MRQKHVWLSWDNDKARDFIQDNVMFITLILVFLMRMLEFPESLMTSRRMENGCYVIPSN